MKKLLITSSIIALTALASCSQVVSPNTKDNDITGLEATYQVTCGDKFEEQSKAVVSTSEDLKFAFYTDEQLTKRYYDIKFDGLVGSISGGTSADYWVKVTAGGGATGYKEVSKVAKITATCEKDERAIIPTDCIGEKTFVCKYCKAKMSSGALMEDEDVVLYDDSKFNYGLTPGVIYTHKDEEPFLDGDISYGLGKPDFKKQIDLPKINFEAYQNQDILLKFRTNNAPGWDSGIHTVYLGTNEEANNLFDGAYEARWAGSAGPDMTGYFLLNYNSTSKELTIKNTIEPDKVVIITDSDIIQGKKSIALYGYSKANSRSFALFEKCIGLNHIHTWKTEETAPTDKIGFKIHECSVCKEREYSDNLMEDSDIKINANCFYGANANLYISVESAGSYDGLWGMAWGLDIPSELKEHEMKFPKVMFKEYSSVTFNFTTSEKFTEWKGPVGVGTSSGNYDLIPYEAVRDKLSGKITATYDESTQKLTLTAWDVTEQNGETQLGTATISIADAVASGNENLILYLQVNNYRGFGITGVTVTE